MERLIVGGSDRQLRGRQAHPIGGAGSATLTERSLRALFGMLSPAGSRGRVTILIFHRVHEHPDSLFPDEMHSTAFKDRMLWVRSCFNVLLLEDAVAALARGTVPARALAITFDDGYADNYTIALPILRQLGLPATFFIATGFLDGGRMWNDTVIEAVRGAKGSEIDLSSLGLGTHRVDSVPERRRTIAEILSQLKYRPPSARQEQAEAIASIADIGLPSDLMLTSAQLRGLAALGMGIGSHTVSHPILARLDDESARREIADSRDMLETIVRQPIKLFAYPNGKPGQDYTAAHVQIARDLGLSAAVSTAPGSVRAGDSLHELPRFTPWGRSSLGWGWRLARNLATSIERAGA
jgi:peptidoglycan/xylan/chitin deacetylase (PgdA/CDA1 family)